MDSDTAKCNTICQYTKGKEVCFLGTYHGQKAWLNDSKPSTGKVMTSVIVPEDNGNLKATRIASYNVKPKHKKPTSCMEAMFQEDPQLEDELTKWCRKAAMYQVEANDLTVVVMSYVCDAVFHDIPLSTV